MSFAQPRVVGREEWESFPATPIVGKDVIELLSSSMYVNPLAIYREYVQNSADAVDAARTAGLLGKREGHIAISIDPRVRHIRIRDDGIGVPASDFNQRLATLGASAKRGGPARGFRGVGRLAGLGYCQALTFRSRAAGEVAVREMRWDCRQLKALLQAADFPGDLSDLLREVVSVRTIRGTDLPSRFFEVELENVIRHRSDVLLDATAVSAYLAEVAPVPFAPSFRFAEEIARRCTTFIPLGEVQITLNETLHIYRPHQDIVPARANAQAERFDELEFFEIPGGDSTPAAVGWVLHHGYRGALPPQSGIGGLRVRSGNMQIGEPNMLEFVFPEPRFNAWTVGEFHILDRGIVPNGRRDHFETNPRFHNFINHLTPVARAVANRCRTSSLFRKWQRDFDASEEIAKRALSILRQNVASDDILDENQDALDVAFQTMEKISARDQLPESIRRGMKTRLTALRRRSKVRRRVPPSLQKLRYDERGAYAECLQLIYECSDDSSEAKTLVDKILRRLSRR